MPIASNFNPIRSIQTAIAGGTATGYLLHDLPVQPLLVSAQDKDAPLMAFVYGTLKRDGRLHENMNGFEFAGEASAQNG